MQTTGDQFPGMEFAMSPKIELMLSWCLKKQTPTTLLTHGGEYI